MIIFLILYGTFVVLYGIFAAHGIICHYRYFVPWQRAWEQAHRENDTERMMLCLRMEGKAMDYGWNPLWFRKTAPELPTVQIDLLPIPRQPQRPEEAAIPTRVIKAYVRNCLKGMGLRQAERERKRAAKRQPKTRVTMPTLFDMKPTEDAQDATTDR